MKTLTAILCLIAAPLFGATYYVATTGDNANPGSQAQPWRNIWHAARTASAGDTVSIGVGTFNEFVTNTVSGITFVGTRGAAGEWLTVVDPSTPMSSGWVSAPEVGSGVWKNTGAPFRVAEMTINGMRVGFALTDGDMQSFIDAAYTSSGWTSGLDLLAVPSDATVVSPLNATTTTFWDGIEALYCSSGTTTWLRLRDGSDPNGLDIRVAPNGDATTAQTTDLLRPGVSIASKGDLTFRDLCFRGSVCPMVLVYTHNVVIESNYLAGGYARIYLAGCTNSTIRYNQITTDWYGGTNTHGAWGSGDSVAYDKRLNHYLVGKFLMGASSEYDIGVLLIGPGSRSNSIYGNVVSRILCNAITVGDDAHYTLIYDNVVTNCSGHGMMFRVGQTNTQVYSNLIADCNINWRFQTINSASEGGVRLMYLYRNRLMLPDSVGDQIFVHTGGDAGSATNKMIWVYHNSFSGGRKTLFLSSECEEIGGLVDFRFINNIVSSSPYYDAQIGFITSSWMMGGFDYNLLTPPWVTYPTADDPEWFGAHNIKSATNAWANTYGMSFALPSNSQAIDAGADIPALYPALPMTGSKSGGVWDIGAVEYAPSTPGTSTAGTATIGTLIIQQ
jgi:hypothetical protein